MMGLRYGLPKEACSKNGRKTAFYSGSESILWYMIPWLLW
jgi:hypothetical protein